MSRRKVTFAKMVRLLEGTPIMREMVPNSLVWKEWDGMLLPESPSRRPLYASTEPQDASTSQNTTTVTS